MDRRCYLISLLTLSGCTSQVTNETSTNSPTDGSTPTVTSTKTPEAIDCDPSIRRSDAKSRSTETIASAIKSVDPTTIADTDVIAAQPNPPEAPVSLYAETGVATLPTEVTIRLENQSEDQFSFGPTDWKLWKADNGGWHRIAPVGRTLIVDAIQPGETHTWTFDLSSAHRTMLHTATDDRENRIGSLGPGVYALSVEGGLAEPDEPPGAKEGESVTVVAVFGLAGDPLVIDPEPAVVENGIVRVPSDGSTELRMEPVETAETPAILEQVAQPETLRSGLPYLFCNDGPDEVVVETTERTARDVIEYLDAVVGSTTLSLLSRSFRVSTISK